LLRNGGYNQNVVDFVFLFIVALVFLLTLGLVWVCQRLMKQ